MSVVLNTITRYVNKSRSVLRRTLRPNCILCNYDIVICSEGKTYFCKQCMDQFAKNLLSCECCAIPIASNNKDTFLCGQCQITSPIWGKALASFVYEYPINKLLVAIKFNKRLEYIAPLASLMAVDIQSSYDLAALCPDCIVPVPLHVFREFRRGYNQADLFAQSLSRLLGIPLNRKLVRRVRHTPRQSQLTKKQRQKNLHNAFSFQQEKSIPKYIALVDDVMTTGSTAEAVTKVLLANGVERVDIWCCARAEI